MVTRSPRGEFNTTVCGINYQLLVEMLPNQPNGQLLIVADPASYG